MSMNAQTNMMCSIPETTYLAMMCPTCCNARPCVGGISTPASNAQINHPRTFRYWVDFQCLSSPQSAALLEQALKAVGGVCTGGPAKADPVDGHTRKDGDYGYAHVEEWDVLWSSTPKALPAIEMMCSQQMVSAVPGLTAISRKTSLARSLMAHLGDGAWQVTPRSFKLPEELQAWRAWVEAHPAQDTGLWMLKNNKQRGSGLRLVRTADAFTACYETARRPSMPSVPLHRWYLAQQYISNPLLIDGRKFGVRVWVLVPGTQPYRAYLHTNGLVLCATDAYHLPLPAATAAVRPVHGSQLHAHAAVTPGGITNPTALCREPQSVANEVLGGISVSRSAHGTSKPSTAASLGGGHIANQAQNEEGVVWPLAQLHTMLGEHAFHQLWSRIVHGCSAAFGAAAPYVQEACERVEAPSHACFQLFGVDFLVDAQLHPWLLEVNASPSMKVTHSQPAMAAVLRAEKWPVCRDMVALLGICPSRFQVPCAASFNQQSSKIHAAHLLQAEMQRRGGFESIS